MKHLSLLLFLALALPLQVDASYSDGKEFRETRKKLSKLPREDAGYLRVKELTMKLIKLNPRKAYSSFKLGVYRLLENKRSIVRLQRQSQRIIKNSKLSDVQKNRYFSKSSSLVITLTGPQI